MGDVKAVFFDIDGTLVSFKTHRVPQSALDAVAALRRRGIKVYIATGRPVAFIDNLGGLEYDGMVTVTGAYCFARGGEVISRRPVPAADVERVVAHLSGGVDTYPVVFVCSDSLFLSQVNEEVRSVFRLLDLGVPPVFSATAALGREVLQLISFFRADRERHFMSTLMPGCSALRWHPSFADVIARGVDKSAGIDQVLAYEGLSLDNAMAFGDGGNDVSMLAHVPCGVAMGNACDELKAVADYVTASVDDDGVAKALRHFGLLD